MKFTMAIPVGVITPEEFQTAAAIREMAASLELADIDACYVTDHPAPLADWLHGSGHDALDPFAALTAVAMASTRLRLHTNIVVLPYRNPFVTAKAAATVQLISDGRLILGVGGGYQAGEFEALGVDFKKRGALFDEGLEVIRLAWGGGAVTKQGRNFNATGNEPRPAPDPQPPIWIGGGSDKAVERAARWGDGWCPFFARPTMTKLNQDSGIQSVDQLGRKITELNELRSAQGKAGQFDIATGPLISPSYGTRDVQQYLDALGELAEVGVTWAMVDTPHPDRQRYIENVQWFGDEVVSRLRPTNSSDYQ